MAKKYEESEKIKRLERMSKDKSLSRKQRNEALAELKYEKFRDDPRPSLSVRKQIISGNWLYASCLAMFCNNFILKYGKWYTFVISGALILFGVITIILTILKMDKYKNEPDDELSTANKNKASRLAFIILIIAALAGGMIWFGILRHDKLVISRSNWTELICCICFSFSLLQGLLFLHLEGNEETSEEDE